MNKVKLFSAVTLLAGSLLQSCAQRPSGCNLDVAQMNRKNKPEGWLLRASVYCTRMERNRKGTE